MSYLVTLGNKDSQKKQGHNTIIALKFFTINIINCSLSVQISPVVS